MLSEPYIKLQEVGTTVGNRVQTNAVWPNTKLVIGRRKPIAVAVEILLSRLYGSALGNELVTWESEDAMNADLDLAIKLLNGLRER